MLNKFRKEISESFMILQAFLFKFKMTCLCIARTSSLESGFAIWLGQKTRDVIFDKIIKCILKKQ